MIVLVVYVPISGRYSLVVMHSVGWLFPVFRFPGSWSATSGVRGRAHWEPWPWRRGGWVCTSGDPGGSPWLIKAWVPPSDHHIPQWHPMAQWEKQRGHHESGVLTIEYYWWILMDIDWWLTLFSGMLWNVRMLPTFADGFLECKWDFSAGQLPEIGRN